MSSDGDDLVSRSVAYMAATTPVVNTKNSVVTYNITASNPWGTSSWIGPSTPPAPDTVVDISFQQDGSVVVTTESGKKTVVSAEKTKSILKGTYGEQ